MTWYKDILHLFTKLSEQSYYQLWISYKSHSESSRIYYCIIYNDL